MSLTKVYHYKRCDRCRQALRWLDTVGLQYTAIPIREQTPTLDEMRRMLAFQAGKRAALMNCSGRDYRALNFKAILNELSEEALFAQLASNGNLIKRPFLIDLNFGLVGFNQAQWQTFFRERGLITCSGTSENLP